MIKLIIFCWLKQQWLKQQWLKQQWLKQQWLRLTDPLSEHALYPWFRLSSIALLCGTLVFSYGCSAVPPLTQALTPPTIDLAIAQVDASTQPGSYQISGNTTLPDQTKLTISAIRPLKAIADDRDAYSILARNIVTVEQGTWDTELNLWQIAADGQFRESWQADEVFSPEMFKPIPDVTFSAILEPKSAAALKSTIESQNTPQLKALEHYNVDGELYLQATKTQTVPLPFGRTTPVGNTNLLRDLRTPAIPTADVTPGDESTVGSATIGGRSDTAPPPDAYLR